MTTASSVANAHGPALSRAGGHSRILAGMLALSVFVPAVVGALILLAGGRLSGAAVLGGWLGAPVWGGWQLVKDRAPFRRMAGIGAAYLVVLALGASFSLLFYDLSYDGQFYHQEAIIRLAQGWNPVHDPPLPLHPERLDHDYAIWVNHYPKAAWIAAASLYSLSGRIELGKIFNVLLFMAVFFRAYALFRALGSERSSAVVHAGLIAANPVVVVQLVGFYVDGLMADAITLVVLSAVSWMRPGGDAWKPWSFDGWMIFLSMIFMMNLKFTGLLYAAVLSLGLVVSAEARRRSLLSLTFLAFVVGICVVGVSPYITNTIRDGHPLHPLFGDRAMDIVHTQFDADFLAEPAPYRLMVALFSRSSNERAYPHLKLPFAFGFDELRAYTENDTRIGGFGPLFSGALILAGMGWGVLLRRRPRWVGTVGQGFGWIVLSVVLNPQSWWARFVPQLYLLPIGSAFVFSRGPGRMLQRLSVVLLAVLEINVALVVFPFYVVQGSLSHEVGKQLRAAAIASRREPIAVRFNYFDPLRTRLREAGVRYVEVETPPCPKPTVLLGARVQMCMPDGSADSSGGPGR